jgi:hypothetical protein
MAGRLRVSQPERKRPLRLRRILPRLIFRRPGALFLALFLAACSGDGGPVSPYVIPPGKIARSGQPVEISVCHSGLTASLDAIAARLSEDCLGQTFLYDEFNLDDCSLLFPRRAVYRCQAVSSRLATERPPMKLEQLR